MNENSFFFYINNVLGPLQRDSGNPANVYLVKKVIQEAPDLADTRQRTEPTLDREEAPQTGGALLCWEYNVAYSVSFEAPALYFDVCRSSKA